jgi:hypothetical protein
MGFPGLEEVLLVVLFIEVLCDIFDLVTFLLNFSIQKAVGFELFPTLGVVLVVEAAELLAFLGRF